MALERKKKMAAQLGKEDIDGVELLMIQGELRAQQKDEKAKKEQAERFAKYCTFVPKTNKKKKPSKVENRTSTGSINLEGVAKKKDGSALMKSAPLFKIAEESN